MAHSPSASPAVTGRCPSDGSPITGSREFGPDRALPRPGRPAIVWALVGGPELFRSVDRGDTWQQHPLQRTSKVSFVDPTHGFVAVWDQDHMPVVTAGTLVGLLVMARGTRPD